jgi:hypothetical protein
MTIKKLKTPLNFSHMALSHDGTTGEMDLSASSAD